MESFEGFSGLPRQSIPFSQKSKAWRKQNVDAAENLGGGQGSRIRRSRHNKAINYLLWDGITNKDDMMSTLNPDNIKDGTLNTEVQHHSVLQSKFNVLIGEEAKRYFEPRAMVTNPDAVSEKEAQMGEMLKAYIVQLIQDPNLDDQAKQAKLAKYIKYLKFEWQDFRELRANRIMKHYMEKLRMRKTFNDGFKDALIAGEEIYLCDIVSGEPIFKKLNPLNVYTVLSGRSNRIEDADVIILENYKSPGQLLEEYHMELKDSDVKQLESLAWFASSGTDPFTNSHKEPILITSGNDANADINGLIDLSTIAGGYNFGAFNDEGGNIRELKIFWKSRKQMKRVTYYDENGEEQIKIRPENYKLDKSAGETSKAFWANEWWEGTKLGSDIYVRMKPKEVQYFRLSNPAVCHPGIIGTVYNTNEGVGTSLIDRVKHYQYLYDSVWDNLKRAFSTYLGPILEVDISKIPEGWSMEQWMYYLKKMKIAVTDSFKEGQRGAAKGKLAGTYNTTGRVFNMDVGNYIQQMVGLLQYIEEQITLITGVSKQREGQTSARETATGIQQSIVQSNSITEPIFLEHDETKLRCMQIFVETAKYALKNNQIIGQHILDDGSTQMFNIPGDEFADADYDVVMTDGRAATEFKQAAIALAHAGMQNDKTDFSTLMDIYLSSSVMDIRRTIEAKEDAALQREQQRFETEQETQKQIAAQAAETQAATDKLDWDKAVLQSNTQIEVALINVKEEVTEVPTELDMGKLALEQQKRLDEMVKFNKEIAIKQQEVDVKRIAANKKPATSKG